MLGCEIEHGSIAPAAGAETWIVRTGGFLEQLRRGPSAEERDNDRKGE
jgi:hypothetical protein